MFSLLSRSLRRRGLFVFPLVIIGLFMLNSALIADDNVSLPNTTIVSGQTRTEQADLTITAPNNYLIQSGGQSIFRAGTRIDLKPGFVVNPGGTFNATIDYNKNAISDLQEELAAIAPPYFASFEWSDGFTLGNLNNQKSWFSGPGESPVIGTVAAHGLWSVSLPARNPPNSIIRYFKSPASGTVMFVDFWAKPHATNSVDTGTLFFLDNVHVAFTKTGSGGQIWAFNGNGAGGGS